MCTGHMTLSDHPQLVINTLVTLNNLTYYTTVDADSSINSRQEEIAQRKSSCWFKLLGFACPPTSLYPSLHNVTVRKLITLWLVMNEGTPVSRVLTSLSIHGGVDNLQQQERWHVERRSRKTAHGQPASLPPCLPAWLTDWFSSFQLMRYQFVQAE